MLTATALPFSEAAHDKFLLRSRFDFQPIQRALSRSINTSLPLRDDAFESSLLCHMEKSFSAILDVAAYLDSRNRSNNFLQSFTPLRNSLAGNIAPIAPEQIEQKINTWSSRSLLPLLDQLETWYSFRISR